MVGLDHAALPALSYAGLRYSLAAIAVSPLLWQARGWTRREWAMGAICGVFGIAGYNLPSVLGQRTVSAGLTGLLNGAEPMLIVLCAALLHRRLPGGRAVLSGLIGLAGIVLLAQGAGPALGDPAGIALVLTGALSWAIYCVIVPPLITARGALPVTGVILFFGALPLAAAGIPQAPALFAAMTGAQWALTLGLVLGASVISILCWNAGAARLGAARAAWFLYLVPLTSLAGGAAFLAEPIRPIELAGGALILVSVFFSQR
jgi:drug/metabolite transporter (DMT)-like permease